MGFRRVLCALFAFVFAAPSLADWSEVSSTQLVEAASQSIIRHEWTTATDSTPYDISACEGRVEARFDPSTGDASTDATVDLMLCRNSTDTWQRCRPLRFEGPSETAWTPINAVTGSESFVLAHPLTSTAGGDTARVEVRCTNRNSLTVDKTETYLYDDIPADGDPSIIVVTDCATDACDAGGGSTRIALYWDGSAYEPIDQSIGSVSGVTNPLTADLEAATYDANANMGTASASINWPQFSITNPATTTMGAGVTWGSDQTAKDRPGGTEIDTRNHLLGWFYNKTGVNGSIVTNCQPAWDWSHETNFRTTAATADDSWPELNFDLYSPRYTTVPTGVTGTFAASDYIEFSGGGFGKVVSWTGGTLTYIHTHGPCAANAQTITNRTGTGAGTVASLTSTQTGAGWIRAMQFEWDAAEDTLETNGPVRWTFDTLPLDDTRPPALRIRNGGVGIYLRDAVTRRLHVQNDGLYNTSALAFFEHDEALASGTNLNADILELRHDYGSNVNTHSYSRGIHVYSPLNGGSVVIGRQHALHIEDMKAFGITDSSVIMIEPQTGGDGGDGNVTFEGGNYASGHLTFGAEGAAGDHFWRDQTNERWRSKTDSLPTSETDGRALAEMYDENNTATLGTSEIASEACASVVTVAATGVATTDVISWGFNGDVTAVTGYAPVTTGALSIYAYPTANNVNFRVCNPTASAITPGAVTLNFNVVR